MPPSYPLQPPGFSAIRADTGRPGPVAFSCSIVHISNWLSFGPFTYLSYTSCCVRLCTSMGCVRVKRSVIGSYCALTLTQILMDICHPCSLGGWNLFVPDDC